MTLPKSALTKSQQKQRRAEALAARNRPRCPPAKHTWVIQDEFSLGSGERCTTWACRTCRETTFVYSDRADP
jgi:hypothetical protein